MDKRQKSLLASLIIGILIFAVIYFQWFAAINLTLTDAVYQRPSKVMPSIKIIAIDEKTLNALGQFETWTRAPYAALIHQLNQGDNAPYAIGIDVLMVNEKGKEDEALVDACQKYDNIVMAQNLILSEKITMENGAYKVDTLNIQGVEQPFGELADFIPRGFVNTVQDNTDNSIRYTLLERGEYRSFAYAVASMADKNLTSVRTDTIGGMYIDYTAGPDNFETLSMIDVLDGKIPAEAFKDSIVLIGAHAPGMGDAYNVPISNGSMMYGVEIHANIIQAILEQRYLFQGDLLINAFICAVIGFVLMLVCCNSSIGINLLLTALVCGGQYGVGLYFDSRGLLINMAALPMGAVLTLLWNISDKYITETLHKQKIIKAFEKYVAPQVVEEVAKSHDFDLKLGGERRHIAVLFVDIRGFTPISESLSPEEIVEILNEYLSLVTNAVFRYGGTLDKFIGDAAMAVFNAPFDTEDYIYKAVLTAVDIAKESDRIAKSCQERFGRSVSYGIGINCGEAVVGNIGSDFRMDYTAIGDTVNTAARLESNAKAGQILISEKVYEGVKERITAQDIGKISLKGKSENVKVYSVEAVKEDL